MEAGETWTTNTRVAAAATKYPCHCQQQHNGALSPTQSSPARHHHRRGSGYCSEGVDDVEVDYGNGGDNEGAAIDGTDSTTVITNCSNQTLNNCSDDCEVLTSESHPPAYERQGQVVGGERFAAATTEISWLADGRQKLILYRHFKDSGFIRNFNSLPIFVYATSTNKISPDCSAIDGSIYRRVKNVVNESSDLERNRNSGMDCMPLVSSSHHQTAAGTAAYQHHHPYTNYHLHHNNHHHIQPEQTKSLQELQNEVGALLEFRDLVIETFPDLKHKMASISAAASTSVSGNNTLTGLMSNSSLASRREWEPGIRIKRKISQKEPSTSITGNVNTSTSVVTAATTSPSSQSAATAPGISGELLSSSLTRSRSNSHSGKKEPKSGETNGSVVQDSGFSTETSSSKEAHSASSTNGAMAGTIASNRLTFLESDDELLNLLDVIHRKSNRLREEVEHLQNYERDKLQGAKSSSSADTADGEENDKTNNSNIGSNDACLTPKTFRDHVERLNKEDIKVLRKERDRLLDKLAEMEAETLTGRIRASKMSDQVEELINVKKDLEEQLKIALSQKLELNSRLMELSKQQQQQSKSSSSQSDYSSQRTILSTGNLPTETHAPTVPITAGNLRLTSSTVSQKFQNQLNTFQPVVLESSTDIVSDATNKICSTSLHQSVNSDTASSDEQERNRDRTTVLGRLDGVVSNPGGRLSKVRVTDPKKITAILLETSVLELQRHLLTLTVQNQVLSQKLEHVTKSKMFLVKKLDKSKEDVDDLRFQLEEKDIELEGTKAQLRVLEARVSSATSSYLHSHQDHETNRSALTTLVTPTRPDSSVIALPPPLQISTPSMKAMIHLPMDEMQHHSSSTESAHDHEHENQIEDHRLLHPHQHNQQQQQQEQRHIISGMSTSVGGSSPFEASRRNSKPSKIPLPGTKNYFAPKPPSGRSSFSSHNKSHSGNSPSTANLSNTSAASSTASNKSLSRSTGNLFGKSPNSLKRTDSAQSIRKDNSSLSTNASRSSSSSIPISSGVLTTKSTPSPYKILANSPLPKLKRDSFTSRVRHLDSLSRAHHLATSTPAAPSKTPSNITISPPYGYHHHTNSSTSPSSSSSSFIGNGSNGSTSKSASTNSAITTTGRGISSTSTVRKDLSSSSFSQGQFLRKQSSTLNPSAAVSTTRRFSSAPIGRGGQRTNHDISGSSGIGGGVGGGSFNTNNISATSTTSGSATVAIHDQQQHNDIDSGKQSQLIPCISSTVTTISSAIPATLKYNPSSKNYTSSPTSSENQEITSEKQTEVHFLDKRPKSFLYRVDEEEGETPAKCCYDDEIPAGDNLLVTFDYGFVDDCEEVISEVSKLTNFSHGWVNSIKNDHMTFSIRNSGENYVENWFYQPQVLESKANFTVYKMQHSIDDDDDDDDDGGSYCDATSVEVSDSEEEDFYDSIDGRRNY